MTSTKTYDFLTDSDYNYTASDIALSGGQAKLALQSLPGQTYNQTYDSDTGFTYDNTKLTFAGTRLEQKSQGPVNSSAFANFETNEDLNWGDAALTGTLFGGATVSGGYLDSTGGGGVSYVATGAINAMKGSVVLLWKPNYTGNPSGTRYLIDFANSSGSSNNRLRLYHDVASAIRMDSSTNVGAGTTATPYGTKSVIAGTEYILQFDWDFTPGSEKHEVYIDGVQQGSTQTVAKTRDDNLTSITYFQTGHPTLAEASYGYLLIANDVLSTPLVTEPPAYRYAEACALSPSVTRAGALDGALLSIETFDATHTGTPKFTIGRPAQGQFWYNTVSEAWETSDSTYSQSNTDAEMSLYLTSFPFAPDTNDFNLCTTFPQSVNTQVYVDNLDVEYTSQDYSEADPVISIAIDARIWLTELFTFVPTVVVTGSDLVKYILVLSGTKTYWDGAAWSASNGTYAESNTAAEITTNIATAATTRKQLGVDIFLHSADGTTSPIISNLVETYTEALPNTALGRLVDISGYVYDNDGPVSSELLEVKPYRTGFNVTSDTGSGAFFIYEKRDFATTVSDGFFSGQCYLQSTGNQWQFKIGKQWYRTALLDQDFNDFNNDLTLTLVED